MAGWLEQIERAGAGILDAAGEAAATRIKSEIAPSAPKDPVNRPETQYDTTMVDAVDGPESRRDPQSGIGEIWATKKWWIVGGLGVTALLVMRSR